MTRFVKFTSIYDGTSVWVEASHVMLVSVGTKATVITLSSGDENYVHVKESLETVVALLEGRSVDTEA